MRTQTMRNTLAGLLFLASAFVHPAPVQAQPLSVRCQWPGTGTPPASRQVIMMPVVMDIAAPGGTGELAFISFATVAEANRDGGGVLRVIDRNCSLIASYPGPGSSPVVPVPCPANMWNTPRLAPVSGLAVGNVDGGADVEIIGLIDSGSSSSNHFQIVAFTLTGGQLAPKWCSAPLSTSDPIPSATAPAIAQLDPPGPGAANSEIIVDNKVFESDGTLRYSGLASGPRSRTVLVANVLSGATAPQVITGAGIYPSSGGPLWTGSQGWVNPNVSTAAPSLVYPAVAELDPVRPGPEIVVTDLWVTRLRVLDSQTGTELASVALPNVGSTNTRCGGPPMIGDVIYPLPGPEIGVASCTRYTLFKYDLVGGSPALVQLWSTRIRDPGGQTTSTLYRGQGSGRIVYADADTLWVFNGANGAVLERIQNTSATAIEGPVIASLDTGVPGSRCMRGPGEIVVVANNHASGFGGQAGVRIFRDTGPGAGIGMVGSCWNQHTFHVTNVGSSSGVIPTTEPPSWIPPARNGYRTQQ